MRDQRQAETRVETTNPPRSTTHPKVVAGVVLITSLMLFSTLFSVTLLLAASINPIETEMMGAYTVAPTLEDYVSAARVMLAAAVASAGTAGFWFAVGE